MKAWIGKYLIGVGVIHSLFAFIFMRATLAVLWGEGLLNTVDGEPRREAVFWFLYTGFLLIISGSLIDRLEKKGITVPPVAAWSFLVLAVLGVIVMPKSGLWLLLPPIAGMVIRAKPQM